MGYAVLHLEKASGNDAGMSAHIERTIKPQNADESRTHLNKELINFPEGVDNRTQAIQHRIDNAGISRKIGKNQVRAIRIMLSGTHEDMKDIQEFGNLKHWCDDNIDWLKQTYGAENLVSAVLHMDEKTPHIHATVVPIVVGERRKAKVEEQSGKKKYKKKSKDAARLCADDVMSRTKLKEYQNSYAECMKVYGLERGIEGSEAKHIGTSEYYKNLFAQKESLQENVESLLYQQSEAQSKVHTIYEHRDEVRNEFLEMDKQVKLKHNELSITESKLSQLKKEYEPYETQAELNFIHSLFPMMKEQLKIASLCEKIGLGIEYIRMLFEGKNLTAKSFSFFSPEHNRKFEAADVKLKIEKEPDDPRKLRLSLNGTDILDWFNIKYREVKESISLRIQPNQNKKGGMKI